MALLFIGSALCISPNAFAQLTVLSYSPAATETPPGSHYYIINEPIPYDAISLAWNFSKGLDAKFVQDISNITVKEKGSSAEVKFDISAGSTTSPAPGYEYDSASSLKQNFDFTYLKVGSGADPIQYRRLSLIPTTVIFEPNKTYVVTVDNETTLDNGTKRTFQANNGDILQYTYSFEFNTNEPVTTTTTSEPVTTTTTSEPVTTTTTSEPVTTTTTSICIDMHYYRDADNDTYGNPNNATVACEAPEGYVDNSTGFDCDDNDAAVHPGAKDVCNNGKDDDCNGTVDDNDTCVEPGATCILQVVPKQISKLLAFLNPFIPFVISADSASGVVFARPFEINWGTEAIDDILRIAIGKRIIVGFLFARPLQLDADEYTVVVTYGDNGTEQCGAIEVK